MIWIVLYFWIAAIVAFVLCRAALKLNVSDEYGRPFLVPAVICSLFWPCAAPIYAAYLAAIWYAESRSE